MIERLVEQHDLGIADQGTGNRQHLLLSARQVGAAARASGFPKPREHFVDTLHRPARGCGQSGNQQVLLNVQAAEDAARVDPLFGCHRRSRKDPTIAGLIFGAAILTLVSIRKKSTKTLLTVRPAQYPTFVHRDVVGRIAFDLVLWFIPAGAMHMPFIVNVLRVHLDNMPLTCPASEFQVT